ncbi:MAG: hypothetical protein FGM15_05320 [Chthoniobacterales bacterium]|nr:hypothetical protein [Chthoniobacterales bacterium]
MLAKATGWSESFILWELPLARLIAYEHANLRANDVWTVRRAEIDTAVLKPLRAFFDSAPQDDDDPL